MAFEIHSTAVADATLIRASRIPFHLSTTTWRARVVANEADRTEAGLRRTGHVGPRPGHRPRACDRGDRHEDGAAPHDRNVFQQLGFSQTQLRAGDLLHVLRDVADDLGNRPARPEPSLYPLRTSRPATNPTSTAPMSA